MQFSNFIFFCCLQGLMSSTNEYYNEVGKLNCTIRTKYYNKLKKKTIM